MTKRMGARKKKWSKQKLLAAGVSEKDIIQGKDGTLYLKQWVGRIRFRPPQYGVKKIPRSKQQRSRIPSEAASLVRNAKAGDAASALTVLIRFCEAVEREDRVPVEILGWMRKAFRQYLRRRVLSLHDLLRLPPATEGRQPDPKKDARNRKIQSRVYALLLQGASHKAAYLTVMEEFGVKKKTVENAWRDYREATKAAKERHRDGHDARKLLFPEEVKVLNE